MKKATQCYQGLSIDFGFVVQKSKNKTRLDDLAGNHGETCYCLIVDHHSQTLYGRCFVSKSAPVQFLKEWLAHRYAIIKDIPDKYVRFDLGGELGKCKEVVELFETRGYHVEPTAPNSSHSNALGERPHYSIIQGIRTLLYGANLDTKYWPYAFHHYLRIYNTTPHSDNDISPYEICSGRKPDLHLLRTFGSRVYVLPAKTDERCRDKSRIHTVKGVFLGYTNTFKNIYYCEVDEHTIADEHGKYQEKYSSNVLTAQHVRFDELMSDRPYEGRSPNAKMLYDATRRNEPPMELEPEEIVFPNLDIAYDPFSSDPPISAIIPYFKEMLMEPLPLGFQVQDCDRIMRPFILGPEKDIRGVFPNKIHTRSVARNITKMSCKGAYITHLGQHPVWDKDDIENILKDYQKAYDADPANVPEALELTLQFMSKPPISNETSTLHLHHVREAALLNAVDHQGLSHKEYIHAIQEYIAEADSPSLIDLDDFRSGHDRYTDFPIHKLESVEMTDDEKQLTRLTRKSLKKLSNWKDWNDCFNNEVDRHIATGLYGDPIPRPKSEPGKPPNIFRIVWNCHIKPDGTRKTRACLDGSKRAAPWLRQQVNTYSGCLEQPCMRLFFALCANENMSVSFGDSTNAFHNSPPPTHQCYLEIDETYQEWYKNKYGKEIDPRKYVIPLYHAMQGHPESGKLWSDMVNDVLLNDLQLISTTHERSLYRGTINGEPVLVARMVDDYAIGSKDPKAADIICAAINKRAVTANLGLGTPTSQGTYARYNGIDLHQTRDYIKVSCESYIERMLLAHGWDEPAHNETDRHDVTPMTYAKATELLTLVGPLEGTKEHSKLSARHKMSYRQLLGELMYAYVVGRLDIGYSVTLLARMSVSPHDEHYTALKKIAKYLRATKHWGLIYRHSTPNDLFPDVPLPEIPTEEGLPTFPTGSLHDLVGYVDASHAADPKTRRSITGFVVCLAGAAVAFKTKLQSIIATSSTEAELVAAVHCAKTVRYLRSVLTDLGYAPSGPTILYEDNEAVLNIINKEIPSERTRHVDIQYFALQSWCHRGIITMKHIPGIITPADASTKAVGTVLHYRHVRRSMGHFSPA